MSRRDYDRDDHRERKRVYERDDHRDRKRPRSREEQTEQLPEIHSIFKGEVASIQTYGAFIIIPGCRKNGLVHKSQISTTRVEDVSEVLEIGDTVYCKVISLGEEGNGKISLSMKVVNQGDGRDLDPNLVITNQEEMRKKKGGGYVQQRIELGAVLNTVCKQCGTKGHMSQNCFQAPGGKSYEILPEIDASEPAPAEDMRHRKEGHKKKKKKKENKKHRKEKHRKKHKRKKSSSDSDDSSSSDSSSSSESDTPPRKKHSKKQKHRKYRDSSSSSSDSSDDEGRRHRRKERRDSSERKQRHKQKKHHQDR